ncbi:MerR family transcriptional regulator [Xanthomonas euvesicatoria]|uniref:MerR family transcriptional regulator n=1 Tax=Xanthomonas euvesicatoria TaxID=456327 RepID=UPI0030C7FDCC
MPAKITIGVLAKETGTNAETIRYYERIGLLATPVRESGNNYRSYSADDVKRLRFVRRGRELGFSIDQVRELLESAGHEERDCAAVDELVTEQMQDIEARIRDLQALHTEFAKMLKRCRGGKIASCRVLEALSGAV